MTTEITMPKLSDTMTEGLFACWRKNIGDRIERGDIIAEVETDKAVMELEAFSSGVLVRTMVQGGENVKVGTILGFIGTEADLAASDINQPVSPAALPQSEPVKIQTSPSVVAAPVAAPVAAHPESGHEKASPLVRRLARENSIDLEQIKGSGPDGRITQDDLNAFTDLREQKENIPAASVSAPAELPPADRGRSASIRQATSTTVTHSWQTIPHFSVSVEIEMDACREIVRELKDSPDHFGYNSLVIKACAGALQKFPLLHPATQPASGEINISFAVALPDGVLMPVIRGCQSLSLVDIEMESVRLAEKSRAGRLTAEEMSGGAFSVSNLGMYGADEFTALIMPGQVAILAVGTIRERAVVRNSTVVAAPAMRVTLSSDHRSIDGAYAASFLAELKSILEKPVSLLMAVSPGRK